MSKTGCIISHEGIEYLCGLIRDINGLDTKLIDDLNIKSNGTFSSVRIDSLLNALKTDCNDFASSLVANLSRLELKVVTNESDMIEHNKLYLIKKAGETSYSQYVIVTNDSGVDEKILLGTCDISMTDYLKITDADSTYCKKTDFDTLKTALTTHTSDTDIHITSAERTKWNEVDNKVNKTDIVDNLTSTDTDKPLSANQGKVLKDEVNLKANDDEVIKKTDITTTIDSTSTDSEIATAKAVNDLLQTESAGNLTIPLNEDLNNLIYNRTRVWMNSQTVEIATFTNMPSGRFTECAVIFIPYENATSDYGEQIFVGNYNRIFIRNKINTTWTAWRRVCTTSVADVPKTKITFRDTTNYEVYNPDITTYEVVNGICYLQADVKVKNKSLTYNKVLDGIPIPKSQKNGMAGAWNSNNTNVNLLFEIRNGALFLAYGEPSQHHLINIAYPVENS